jgi:hypothetical protein
MKHSAKIIIGIVACAVCLLAAPTTQAGWGRGGGWHGGWGYRGGYRGWGWYPWGISLSYSAAPYYYYPYGYYYPPSSYYYYSSPPAIYSSQPSVMYNSPPAASEADYNSAPPPPPPSDSSAPDSVDRPLSPTAANPNSPSLIAPPPPPPAPSSSAAPPPPTPQAGTVRPGSVGDIKALAKAGLSDDVILSHVRNSRAVYHLTTAEIIDMKQSGVSDRVIDFMINTASGNR